MKAGELKLGSSIQINSIEAYGTAIVTNKKLGQVFLERPYMIHAGYESTAGVSVSIGVERWCVWNDYDSFTLVREPGEIK